MARLPNPGGDDGAWGDILNEFLSVSLSSDGSLKSGVDQSKVTNLVSDLAAKETPAGAQAKVDAHASASDPHSVYQKESEKGSANGYASLGAGGLVPSAQLGSGTANSSVFLRGDSSWQAVSVGGVFINVQDEGATGDGSTDDAAAIQAAIDNSSVGDTIFFPAGIYIVSATVSFLPDRTYRGSNPDNTILKMQDGANLNAVFAADRWVDNNAFPDDPVHICDLGIDGNKANNSSGHGIVVYNYYSIVRNCRVTDVSENSFQITANTQNGTLTSNPSAVENRLINCVSRTPGGIGFYVYDTSANKVSDGYMIDCIAHGGTIGISIDSGNGWEIDGNHIYGNTSHGIRVNRAFASRVTNNYIEGFGSAGGGGNYYMGIYMQAMSTPWGSVIANNFIQTTEQTGAFYRYIQLQASSSLACYATVVGNVVYGSGGANGIGIRAEVQSGGTLSMSVAGNRINNVALSDSIHNTGVTAHTEYDRHVSVPVFGPPVSQTGWNILTQTNATYFAMILQSSLAQNDEIVFSVRLGAGTYTLQLLHQKGNNRGIYTFQVDGSSVGTIDGYDSSTVNSSDTVTGIAVTSSGTHTLRVLMATKNGTSSNYRGAMSAIFLTRTA